MSCLIFDQFEMKKGLVMWRFGCVLLMVSSFAVAEQYPLEECKEPEWVSVADGAKVSADKMLHLQVSVQGYIEGTQLFLSCLLEQEDALNEEMTLAQKKDSITRYNLAIARMESLVENYNAQLNNYLKKQSE